MARRRAATVTRSGGVPVLPAHLADQRGKSREEFAAWHAERRDWFAAHGINPADWSQVYPVLRASWQAHNIPRPRRLVIKE